MSVNIQVWKLNDSSMQIVEKNHLETRYNFAAFKKKKMCGAEEGWESIMKN